MIVPPTAGMGGNFENPPRQQNTKSKFVFCLLEGFSDKRKAETPEVRKLESFEMIALAIHFISRWTFTNN